MSLGPLVRKEVRLGGAFLAVGSLQFIAAMVATQLAYPGYSDSQNAVSDLGGSHSPWALLFNLSIRVLGILSIIGILLIRSALRKGLTARLGVGLIVLAGLGAVGVGVFTEGNSWHASFAALTFVASGFGLLFLALGMLRDTRWDGYRLFTLLAGLVTFLGLELLRGPSNLGLGAGGAERLVIAPILLWGIIAGIHLARLPVYGGRAVSAWSGAAEAP
ncbi:MAG: DUF998 domain-containing protein [Thermoplasmata archaeon]|nr:DUF998 domain-containing protein [Thermoplasmata archaeon]